MRKLKLMLNRARMKHHARKTIACCDRYIKCERRYLLKRFNKYFNKLMHKRR